LRIPPFWASHLVVSQLNIDEKIGRSKLESDIQYSRQEYLGDKLEKKKNPTEFKLYIEKGNTVCIMHI
jgi:hypothetical protein